MKYYFILLLLSFLTGCKESEKEKIARLVKEWDGKEISFPPHSVFTIQGKDTIDFSFADAEYKIVTYVDSVGCTSCKLQLPRWKEFMHEVDSLVQGKVPFVFYFHPKDVYEYDFTDKGISSQTQLRSSFMKGAINLAVTDDYIYILFDVNSQENLKRLNNEIWKFDWEGNLICKYKPNIDISLFTLSSCNNIIGLTNTEEPQIVIWHE